MGIYHGPAKHFPSFMGNFLYKTLLYDGEYSLISLDYFHSSNLLRPIYGGPYHRLPVYIIYTRIRV
jgi:hypothetical protein